MLIFKVQKNRQILFTSQTYSHRYLIKRLNAKYFRIKIAQAAQLFMAVKREIQVIVYYYCINCLLYLFFNKIKMLLNQ